MTTEKMRSEILSKFRVADLAIPEAKEVIMAALERVDFYEVLKIKN